MSSNIRVKRICANCSKEFEARTTVTKFCGDNCAKKAYKKRSKSNKVEKSNIETASIKSVPYEIAKVKEYLNVQEACLLLGISRTTLWRLQKDNKIKISKIEVRAIITKQEIELFIKQL